MSKQDKQYTQNFRWRAGKITVMSAKAANGVGTEQDVRQFGWVGVAVFMNGFTGTLKCQGSFEKTDAVDFGAAQGASNLWDYVSMYDYQDAAKINGDTGITGAATTDVRQFTVNQTELASLNFEVSGFAAGAISVHIFPVNNQ